MTRHDRLQEFEAADPNSSLWAWTAYRSPARVMLQYAIIACCRILPSLRAKNALYRLLGMDCHPRAGWGLEATPDVFWPQLIEIGPNTIVGYDATILCHEFLADRCRVGPVRIEAGAMIGAKAVVLPGVTIGADAQVAANSLVDRDVPPGITVAGVPARPVASDPDDHGGSE